MGMNFQQAGFADVAAMVAAMQVSEDTQLSAMAAFLGANHLAAPLAAHDGIGFALGYNGPDYARNNYDGLLQQFHGRFTTGPLPELGVRAVQVLLTYKGLDPKGIDGVLGQGTRPAIIRFQSLNGMAQTGEIDDALVQALLT
jgi:N-acetylmuramidase/Putative peptidoglycan binding domain